MAIPPDFSKFVPGFDFLQGLLKSAGQSLPDMGQWIAPTVDPLELEKRIEQLKTVQFWLDQNSRMLQASIQALEVQRMTLSTLHSMNVPLSRMADAFQAAASPPAASSAAPAPEPAPRAASEPGAGTPGGRGPATDKPAGARPTARKRAGAGPASATSSAAGATSAVDPMKWWGALTQQFGQLAAQALKDMPAATATATNRAAAAAPADAGPKPARPRPARKTRPARPRKA